MPVPVLWNFSGIGTIASKYFSDLQIWNCFKGHLMSLSGKCKEKIVVEYMGGWRNGGVHLCYRWSSEENGRGREVTGKETKRSFLICEGE